MDTLKDNTALRCIIFRSLVPNVFCSGSMKTFSCVSIGKKLFSRNFTGADLKERLEMPLEEVGPFVSKLREIFGKIFALPVPTVAALDGSHERFYRIDNSFNFSHFQVSLWVVVSNSLWLVTFALPVNLNASFSDFKGNSERP